MRSLLATSVLAVAVAVILWPGAGRASPASARVSAQGLDVLEKEVKALVPSHLDLEPIAITLSADLCSEGPITFTQENTHVDIALESFSLQPLAGALRVDAVVSVSGTGDGHFERVYGCFGRETCGESVSLQHAHFTIDLGASIDGQGRPHVSVQAPVIDLRPENTSLSLSGCPEAGLVNGLYGFLEKYALGIGASLAKKLVAEKVGPTVESVLASYMTTGGQVSFVSYRAALTGVDFSTAGITLAADVDLGSVFPPASCLGTDPGEPGPVAGAAPDLASGTPTDLAVAVNLGVVQDALYHVWHEGLMCVTPDTLDKLKIDLGVLDELLGTLLSGVPSGTKWAIEANAGVPPTVEGSSAQGARLAVHANQLSLDLIATLPDGASRSLHADLDVTATASVVIDPADNALALTLEKVTIDRMALVDHLGLAADGADFDHLKTALETSILPGALGSLGQIPITGPVFGGIAHAYVILRELRTTPAYLVAKADLFVAPAVDTSAPTTAIVTKPGGTVKPADARLVFGGTDQEDPTELLRYRVIVDGKAAEPSYLRALTVGHVGTSGTVHVEVHAIDLAGNEDAAGARADVEVDGVPPALTLLADLRGAVSSTSPGLSFMATDDRTAAAALVVHLAVTEMAAGRKVIDRDLAAGARAATLDGLVDGKGYQAVLTVRDQAGNETAAQMQFQVDAGGGCSVAGGGAADAALVVLAILVSLGLGRGLSLGLNRGSASSVPRAARRRRYTAWRR